MEGNGKIEDLLPLLDLHSDLKKKFFTLLKTNQEIWETKRLFTRLQIQYIGESSIYFWFIDTTNGSGFTISKKEFSFERIEKEVKLKRKDNYVRIRF